MIIYKKYIGNRYSGIGWKVKAIGPLWDLSAESYLIVEVRQESKTLKMVHDHRWMYS